ncbi:MAG: TonB-dependent receptor domain-containing protein [Cellvibrionaceae bacterium]
MIKSLNNHCIFGATLFIFCMLSSTVIHSQENNSSISTVDCSEGIDDPECNDVKEVDEITVTGSRIKRDTFSSTSPIQVITAERSALAGLIDASDILQSSAAASGQQIDDSFSGFVTDGGPGANSIGLRGLGAQRTLTLVNGKRWGPSGVRGAVNSVDLSSLPSTIVNRYEILKDGASSIYGADAVGGVVNVITKERVDGFQFNATGVDTHQGGAKAYSLDSIWGTIGENWSFNIGANYSKQENLVRTDREYSECDTNARTVDSDGDGVIDNTDPATGEPLCFGFIYGLSVSPFGFVRYDPSLDPSATPANPNYDPLVNGLIGIPFFTRAPEGPLDSQGPFYNDTRSFGIEEIVPETELFSITSFADIDVEVFGRSATIYGEFYYNKRETQATSGYSQVFPNVPADNPTNPFGILGPLGIADGDVAVPVLPTYEIMSPTQNIEVERSNTFVGIKGDITSEWTYDAYLGYSNSKGIYEAQRFIEDRFYASLDASLDTNNNLVCNDLVNFPNCVPVDLFTEAALLNGQLPAEFLDFARKDTKGETTYRQKQLSGYVTGPLFELPAGPLNTVIGIEARESYIDDTPDIEAQFDNIYSFTSSGITTGTDKVKEVFTELEIPILSNLFLAEELLIDGSYRYTDYDSYGSDDTYRVRINWQINETLRLRGTKGTSFRAPALYEQFLANQTGFVSPFGADPCIDYGTNNNPGDNLYDNCASLGLAPDFGTTGALPSIRSVTGGNQDLEAETSDSWTAGFIFTPLDLGLSISLSWFDIEIENSVAGPSVGYVLFSCYNSENFSNAFCSRTSPRDASGALTDVDSSLVNVGIEATKGIDIDIAYEYSFPSFDFAIDAAFVKLDEQTVELFEESYDLEERWGFPEWRGDVDFRFDYKDWLITWNMSYIGESEEEPTTVDIGGVETPNSTYKANSAIYHTLGARYRSPDDWEIIGTIRNIGNKQPPIVGSNVSSDSAGRVFNTLPGTGYDILGRSFVLQFSKFF